MCELRRHTYANTVDYRTLKKFIGKIFPACRCKEVAEKHENALKVRYYNKTGHYNRKKIIYPSPQLREEKTQPGVRALVAK